MPKANIRIDTNIYPKADISDVRISHIGAQNEEISPTSYYFLNLVFTFVFYGCL